MPRPRSESFYLKLSPDMTACLSIQTKASLSARSPPPPPPPTTATRPALPSPSPFRTGPRTPAMHTVALPDDADDERDAPAAPTLGRKRSNPELRLASVSAPAPATVPATPTSTHAHASSPNVPSPLRRVASQPFCPSALFSSQPALLPLYPVINAPLLGLSSPKSNSMFDAAADRFRPVSRRRIPLYKAALKKAFFAGPSGSCARRFGVRTAYNIDEDVRRAARLADPFRSCFEDDEDEEPAAAVFRSADIEDAIEEAISEIQIYRPAKRDGHHSSSDSSDDDSSSGSDGSEDGPSNGFYDSSSDEEGESELETDGSWEVISL